MVLKPCPGCDKVPDGPEETGQWEPILIGKPGWWHHLISGVYARCPGKPVPQAKPVSPDDPILSPEEFYRRVDSLARAPGLAVSMLAHDFALREKVNEKDKRIAELEAQLAARPELSKLEAENARLTERVGDQEIIIDHFLGEQRVFKKDISDLHDAVSMREKWIEELKSNLQIEHGINESARVARSEEEAEEVLTVGAINHNIDREWQISQFEVAANEIIADLKAQLAARPEWPVLKPGRALWSGPVAWKLHVEKYDGGSPRGGSVWITDSHAGTGPEPKAALKQKIADCTEYGGACAWTRVEMPTDDPAAAPAVNLGFTEEDQ